jgi:hypothetical protein
MAGFQGDLGVLLLLSPSAGYFPHLGVQPLSTAALRTEPSKSHVTKKGFRKGKEQKQSGIMTMRQGNCGKYISAAWPRLWRKLRPLSVLPKKTNELQ